jgi:cytochrome c-type biogenesis protein CcmH/NrfG
MNGSVTDPRASSALREHELLARLGLGPGASNDEVEAAHDEILDFLGKVPSSLRGWARVQLTDADEAYARLNGAPASASYSEPAPMVAAPLAATSKAPAPAVRATRPAGPTIRGGIDDDLEGFYDDVDEAEADGPVVITRRGRRGPQAQAVRVQSVARPRAQSGSTLVVRRGALRPILAVGAVVVLVVGALGIYGLGSGGVPGINGTPAPAASGGLDTAAVAADMQKYAANPNDTTTLMDLATLYYQSGDYTTSETWLQKVLAVDPKNVAALLALGAANFNTGDDADAQTAWEQVLTIDTKNVEAHYDLGFMYFSQNPPNIAKVQDEWGQVVALAPDSDIAQTVKTHLAQLGGSPGPSGAPAASPAPSTGPSAS